MKNYVYCINNGNENDSMKVLFNSYDGLDKYYNFNSNDEILDLIKNGSDKYSESELRGLLVGRNIRLIVKIINSYMDGKLIYNYESCDDYIEVGVEIALKAIDGFDCKKGNFSTYIVNKLKYGLKDYIDGKKYGVSPRTARTIDMVGMESEKYFDEGYSYSEVCKKLSNDFGKKEKTIDDYLSRIDNKVLIDMGKSWEVDQEGTLQEEEAFQEDASLELAS